MMEDNPFLYFLALLGGLLLVGYLAWHEGYDEATRDAYADLGSNANCYPSPDWPCWAIAPSGCLILATGTNATEVVSHCSGPSGGWEWWDCAWVQPDVCSSDPFGEQEVARDD